MARIFVLGALAIIAAAALTSCGDGNSSGGIGSPMALAVPERAESSGDPVLAGGAVTDFGHRLFAAARNQDPGANLTVSPASVAIALAMVEPGAVGDASTQLHDLLGIDDPAAFHAAMSALEHELEARQPQPGEEGDPGEVTARIANAAYLQEGQPFEVAYLDAIGTAYGPVLYEVDFEPDPDAVAHQINQLVAEETEGLIPELIADGVIHPSTVLALVNALYLRASWLEPFEAADTVDGETFTLLGGSETSVSMMHGESSSSAAGDGWVGATKAHTGGIETQFILPDEGRFGEIAGDPAAAFDQYEAATTSGAELGVPRFETRSSQELTPVLQALGLTAPYRPGGLVGIIDDDRLVIDKVIHESLVAMDEEGIEAAAATVVLGKLTSGPPSPPVPVVLDRPFLYRIIDTATGATLFIGQVADPSSA
jgi:serpin B